MAPERPGREVATRGLGRRDGRRLGSIVLALTLGLAAVVLFLPRIPQDPAYHRFADQRTLLGVPNFVNVVSNAGFALVGALGLGLLVRRGTSAGAPLFIDPRERWSYLGFFAGAALTSVGSAYYHWAPDNARLVWDRLPMTLAFMSVFAAVVGERIRLGLGLWLLPPLLAAGIGSVTYWHLTERAGAGDLRPYILVQFYPMLVIPLLLALFPPRYTRGVDFVTGLALYASAKVLEALDRTILHWTGAVSGHALKHLVAALACYWILRMLRTRRRIGSPENHGREAVSRCYRGRKGGTDMRQTFLIGSLAVGALFLAVGCATKSFVREEVTKSETKLAREVGRVDADLGEEKSRLRTVTSEVAQVRVVATEATQKAEEAGGRAGQAAAKAEEATGKATQAVTRADEARGRAEQAALRADEATGKAGQAMAKAEETDSRLTRLWTKRNQKSLLETVVVTFSFDKWELDDRAQTALLDLVKQLQANGNLIVDLEGYTDNMGPGPYNLQLSQRRAEAVRRFLVEKGIDVHRIQSIGLGDARPTADNKSKQGRDQNRRVAVKVFAPAD